MKDEAFAFSPIKEEAIEIAAKGRSGAGRPSAWTQPTRDAIRSAQADITAEGSLAATSVASSR
jgi:hypothetical protein